MVLHCRIPDWTRAGYTAASLNKCINSTKYSILFTDGGLVLVYSYNFIKEDFSLILPK